MKKWSAFIYKFELNDKMVMFCTNSRAIVTLEVGLYNEISRFMSNSENNLQYSKEISQLEEMRFIVDAEVREFENLFNAIMKIRESNDYLSITFMPTTDCNFACKYCFEKGIDTTFYINDEVITAFLSFLQYYIDNCNSIKKLRIELFGGEPTLSWEHVVSTLHRVKSFCVSREILMFTSIITNGYLFNEEKIKDLLPFNFDMIQITFDGYREYHDNCRHTKMHAPTFDVLIGNIQVLMKLTDKLKLSIRINCYDDNIESIHKLIDYVYKQIGTNRVTLSFSPIFEPDISLSSEKELLDNYTPRQKELNKIAVNYGFGVINLTYLNAYCSVKINDSFIIHPNGDIYQCNFFVGREKFKLGSVFENKPFKYLFDINLYNYCIKRECCFLPLCHAGCVRKSFVAFGDINKLYCLRQEMEEINKRYVMTKLGLIE